MSSNALPLPDRYAAHEDSAGFVGATKVLILPRLSREYYLRRIAVAIIISKGTDPEHKRVSGLPCYCRSCRAWVCVRITPPDELKEASYLAEELKTKPYIDDRGMF